MAINLDRRIIQQTQLSGLKQVDASPFVAAGQGFAQFGKDVQDLGTAAGNFAIREQKIANAMHMSRSDATRKIETGKLRDALLNPQIFNANTYEQQYNNGIKKINESLVKVAPNSRLKALVGAEGLAYHSAQSSIISKEARVFRVKQLKVDGLQDVQDLRVAELEQDDSPIGLLKKAELKESINTTLDRMVEGNILDPSVAQAEKDKLNKDRQQGALRKALLTAKSEEEYEQLLGQADQLNEGEREIFLDKYRTKKVARDKFAIQLEERAHKLAERKRTSDHRTHDADILSRANDLDPATRPTDVELDDLLDKDLISVSAFKAVQTAILNPPQRAIETNGNTYQEILDAIDKPPNERTIDAANIWSRLDLEDTDKRTLIGILRKVDDGKVGQGRKILSDVIGTPETFIAMKRPELIAQVKVLRREYYDRVQAGEDPIEVANNITDRWRKASDVTSDLSQNRVVRAIEKLPEKYRIYSSAGKNGLKIPDTAEINDSAATDYATGDISPQEFLVITDAAKGLEEVWTPEQQEKHGGRETPSTMKRKRLVRKEEEKLAEEAEAKKLEAEKNSFANKATESIKGAVSDAKESVKEFVNRPPDAPLDTRDTGDSRERAEQIQAKEREERKRGREVLQEFVNKPADEILKDVESLTMPVLQKLQQALSSINISGSPEAPEDNRNIGDSRERAEKLQAKERKERQASKRDKKSKEAAPAKSFVPESSATVSNSLSTNWARYEVEELKIYARLYGNKLRRSERKKLTALLKKKGVTGNALKKLEEQISLGLTKDN